MPLGSQTAAGTALCVDLRLRRNCLLVGGGDVMYTLMQFATELLDRTDDGAEVGVQDILEGGTCLVGFLEILGYVTHSVASLAQAPCSSGVM